MGAGDSKALVNAISAQDESKCNELITAGTDLSGIYADFGMDVLTLSIYFGLPKVALHLVDAGAKLNGRDKYANTALSWAIRNKHTDVALVLVDKCSAEILNAVVRDGPTALVAACAGGLEEVARALISKGAAVNPTLRDTNDRTPLAHCISQSPKMDAIAAALRAAGATA